VGELGDDHGQRHFTRAGEGPGKPRKAAKAPASPGKPRQAPASPGKAPTN
jgi:hypothetical protein